MKQFRVGDFDIDVNRCLISTSDSEVNVEPKVMDVLLYLYTHQGEVVSQQQIFSAVWPNSIFNPSSVQRCIALLRKALEEDSKSPRYLITHPKRGYSLELPEQNQPKINPRSHVTYLVAICLGIIVIWYLNSLGSIKTEYSRLLPITSSGANESSLSLSPNGKYIAFIRGDDEAKNIWLKEVETGKEVKLSSRDSVYYSLGWSPEGSALAYMEYYNNERIMAYFTLDKVTLQPASRTEIRKFPEFHVSSGKLQWLENNHIYFTEQDKTNNDTWLSYVNIENNSRHQVTKADGQDWLLTMAVAPDQKSVALAYEVGQNRYRIDVFNLHSREVITLATVENGIWGLTWHPDGEGILVSSREILHLIKLNGDASIIAFDNYNFIKDAQFHPSGNEIFMELLNIDVDILRKHKANPGQTEVLVDTSSRDFFPIFSPGDERFVFESHRSGLKQLFVYEDGQQKLVFANPDNEELFGIVWTKDGKEVITASKDKIFRIDVESSTYTTMPHKQHPVYLQEHFSHENAMLVSYRADDGVTFHPAKLDLDNMELTTYTSRGKKLACFSMDLDDSDNIFVANSQNVFRYNSNAEQETVWQSNDAKISGLNVHGNSISLKLDNDQVFQISRINLDTGEMEVVHQGIEDGSMLTNSSNNLDQFLYLSKPVRTSNLVRLQ